MSKKIAFLAPEIHTPLIEGIQKNAWFIIKEAVANGHEVSVFTQRSYGEEILDSKISIFYWLSCSKIKFFKYFTWIFNGLKIAKKIKQDKSDYVLVFSLDWSFFWTLVWLKIISKKTDVRLIIFSKRELCGINKLMLIFIKKLINVFFVRSVYLKEILDSIIKENDRIFIATVFPGKEKFLVKDRLISSLSKIAYLSNTEKSAGVETIIEVASKIPEINFILALRIFSEEEESIVAEFIKKIRLLNIGNIEIRRNIDDMPSFYQEVDAVILPVINENNTMSAPLVFLEAISSGCLVFMNKIKIFSEYDGVVNFFNNSTNLVELIKDFNRGVLPELSKRERMINNFINEKDALKIYLK